MYRRILAFDFDGTLAENGIVPPALRTALKKLRAAGYVLFLVTGRRFGDAELGPLGDIFAGIVWENGAVLHHTATDEVYLPFGHIDPRLVEALKMAGVPLEHGRAIERGPRLELAADPGSVFSRLLRTGIEEVLA